MLDFARQQLERITENKKPIHYVLFDFAPTLVAEQQFRRDGFETELGRPFPRQRHGRERRFTRH